MRALLLFSCCVLGNKLCTAAKKGTYLLRVCALACFVLLGVVSCVRCNMKLRCPAVLAMVSCVLCNMPRSYWDACVVACFRAASSATCHPESGMCALLVFVLLLVTWYVLGKKLCTAAKRQTSCVCINQRCSRRTTASPTLHVAATTADKDIAVS